MGILKAYEFGKGVVDFAKAMWNIGKMLVTAGTVIVTGEGPGAVKGAAAGEAAGGGGILGFLSRNALGTGVVGATLLGLQQARESYKWSLAHPQQIISEKKARAAKGGTVAGEANLANFPDSPAMREYAEKHRQASEAVSKTASAENNAAPALSNTSSAANAAASSLNSLSAKMAGWHPPMLPTGVPPEVKPHALGGIFTTPHIGLIAERGPEAIIPLAKSIGGGLLSGGLRGALGAGLGALHINSSPTIHAGHGTDHAGLAGILEAHARDIAAQVLQILQMEMEQSAVV